MRHQQTDHVQTTTLAHRLQASATSVVRPNPRSLSEELLASILPCWHLNMLMKRREHHATAGREAQGVSSLRVPQAILIMDFFGTMPEA